MDGIVQPVSGSAIGIRHVGRGWGLLVVAMLSVVPDKVVAQRSKASRPTLPLEVMTRQDAEGVGAVGTGCTWKGGPDRTARLSMADDRAGVKGNGRVIALKPAPDAKALFLTYDSWLGEGVRIVVRDSGRVVRRGREFSETTAWLDLMEGGRTRSFLGRLDCGS